MNKKFPNLTEHDYIKEKMEEAIGSIDLKKQLKKVYENEKINKVFPYIETKKSPTTQPISQIDFKNLLYTDDLGLYGRNKNYYTKHADARNNAYGVKASRHPNFKIQHIMKELAELNDTDLSYVFCAIKEEMQSRENSTPIKIGIDLSSRSVMKKDINSITGANIGSFDTETDVGPLNIKTDIIPLSREEIIKQIEKLCEENDYFTGASVVLKEITESSDDEELVKFYNTWFEEEFGMLKVYGGKFFFTEE